MKINNFFIDTSLLCLFHSSMPSHPSTPMFYSKKVNTLLLKIITTDRPKDQHCVVPAIKIRNANGEKSHLTTFCGCLTFLFMSLLYNFKVAISQPLNQI